jgi:hypothetical protein
MPLLNVAAQFGSLGQGSNLPFPQINQAVSD